MSHTVKVKFAGKLDVTLDAKLDLPDQPPIAYAILAHCFACSKDLVAEARISAALTQHGIAVFRFDFTGLGKSEGDFAKTNFTSNVDDILAAADYLRKNYQAPSILIGHSLGGTAILAAAKYVPEALAVATIAAPSDPAHILHHFESKLDQIKDQGDVPVDLGGGTVHISQQFIDDVRKQDILKSIGELNKALLLFHSPVDTVVSIDHARKIYNAAKHPKSFISLDHANHLLTNKADAIYVANVLSAWASRYLNNQQPQFKTTNILTVQEAHLGKFTQLVSLNDHQLYADEPTSYGGNDLGLSPYDFLLAALGSCTSMTIRLYAERKNIPVEHISVQLTHNKIHADDCKTCDTNDEKLDSIERGIKLTGNLSSEQKKQLIEIAEKCPVHRTLNSKIIIKTKEQE